jgi:pectin methylesterase-like acyl-CoA thioesterase
VGPVAPVAPVAPVGPAGPSGPSHEERNAVVRASNNKNFRVFIAKKFGFYKKCLPDKV